MTVRSALAVRPPRPMTLPRSSGCTRTSRPRPRRSPRLSTRTSSGYSTMPRTRCSRASSSTSVSARRLRVSGRRLGCLALGRRGPGLGLALVALGLAVRGVSLAVGRILRAALDRRALRLGLGVAVSLAVARGLCLGDLAVARGLRLGGLAVISGLRLGGLAVISSLRLGGLAVISGLGVPGSALVRGLGVGLGLGPGGLLGLGRRVLGGRVLSRGLLGRGLLSRRVFRRRLAGPARPGIGVLGRTRPGLALRRGVAQGLLDRSGEDFLPVLPGSGHLQRSLGAGQALELLPVAGDLEDLPDRVGGLRPNGQPVL